METFITLAKIYSTEYLQYKINRPGIYLFSYIYLQNIGVKGGILVIHYEKLTTSLVAIYSITDAQEHKVEVVKRLCEHAHYTMQCICYSHSTGHPPPHAYYI